MSSKTKTFEPPALGKILFVEDDELFFMKIKKDFERSNIQYDHFETTDEALRALVENTYHAVVTDMYLNADDPNGLEVVKKSTQEGLPTVVVTAAIDLHVAKESLNLGADYILEKPFDIKQLRSILVDLWENPKGLLGRRERCFEQSGLTPKERDFARLILKGLSNKEIADVMETTVSTVKFYTNQIYEKCEVGSRGELFNLVFPT